MKPHRVLFIALFIVALLTGTRVGVDASGLPQASTTYSVKQGDTLSGIAQRFSSTVQAIKQANGLSNDTIYPGQQLAVPQAGNASFSGGSARSQGVVTASSGSVMHLVRAGDTLSSIALQYGTTVSALKLANGLSSDTILVGQTLRVPGSSGKVIAAASSYVPFAGGSASVSCSNPYTVRVGDTLSAIAARCGVTVSNLKSFNSLGDRSILRPGQTLSIPVVEAPGSGSGASVWPVQAAPTPTRVPARPPSVYGGSTP